MIEQQVERTERRGVLLFGVRELLDDLASLGARAQHRFGRDGSVREQSLVDAYVLVDEWQRRAIELRDSLRAGDSPVARLHLGGEATRGRAYGSGLCIARGGRRPYARADRRLVDRLSDADAGLLGERQR